MLNEWGLHRMAWFYAAMFAVGLGLAALGGFNAFTTGPLAPADAAVHVALGVAGGLAFAVLSALASRWVPALRAVDEALAALIGPVDVQEALIMAAFSGLCEEVLFRGALQPLLGPVAATVLFGLAHLPPRRDLWPWSLTALVAGAGLAALTLWSGNILGAVAAHAVVNAVGLVRLGKQAGAR
ncbi:MAG: CPBP family intramembrane metalloprotease [Deltaproteobacteria bacterium]|nr:CPBP family intramembrane metalloprotease [Deltaproteobacteria bacterium]